MPERTKGRLESTLAVLQMNLCAATFLGMQFLPVLVVVGVPCLWAWSRLASAGLAALVVADLLIPLRKERWDVWWRLSDGSDGQKIYNGAKIIRECTLDEQKKYILVYHPHGLYAYGFHMAAHELEEYFGTKSVIAGAPVLFNVPLLRRLVSWMGVVPASSSSIKKQLRPYPQNCVILTVGGIPEMFYGLDSEEVVLSCRKGFCALALKTGASLIPCYCFGGNEVYTRWFGRDSIPAKLTEMLGIGCVAWSGRWGIPFNFIPRTNPVVLAMGPAIDVVQTDTPSEEQVEQLHAQYVSALRSLFDRHKGKVPHQPKRQRLLLETE